MLPEFDERLRSRTSLRESLTLPAVAAATTAAEASAPSLPAVVLRLARTGTVGELVVVRAAGGGNPRSTFGGREFLEAITGDDRPLFPPPEPIPNAASAVAEPVISRVVGVPAVRGVEDVGRTAKERG